MTDESTDFNQRQSSIKDNNFICGVIEGFYGRPWTTEQRKDLFRKYVVSVLFHMRFYQMRLCGL